MTSVHTQPRGQPGNRGQWRATPKAIPASVSIIEGKHIGNGQYLIRFKYNPRLVEGIKAISGRKWDQQTRTWQVPGCAQLAKWCEQLVPETGNIYNGDPIICQPNEPPNVRLTHQGVWEVHTGFSATLKRALSKIGKWNPTKKVWECPPDQAPALTKICSEYSLTADETLFHPHTTRSTPACEPVHPQGLKFRLRNYQAEGVGFILSNRRVLIADQPRLGKTAQALGACHHEGGTPIVVVCPPALRLNWKTEVTKTLPDSTTVYVLDSTPPEGTPKPLNHDVVIVGYTGLHSKLAEWIPPYPKHLIFDESHYIKNMAAKRTKAALQLAARARTTDGLIIGLSATPLMNRPLDLLGQLNAIGRRDSVAASDWKFKTRYCGPKEIWIGRRSVTDFKGATNTQELRQSLMNGIMLRRVRSDVIKDLPSRFVQPVMLEIEPAMRALYKKCARSANMDLTDEQKQSIIDDASEHDIATEIMQAISDLAGQKPEESPSLLSQAQISERRYLMDIIARCEPGKSLPKNIQSRAERAMSEASGLQKITMLRQLAAVCKTPTVKQIIGDWLDGTKGTDDKMVVFAHHRSVLNALADHLNCDVIHGSVGHNKRQQIIDRFQNPSSDARLLVCGIDAASEGISLAAANDVLFVEQPWNPARLEQAEERVFSVGKTQGLSVQYLLAKDTFDSMIDTLVRRKRRVVGEIISDDATTQPKTAIHHGALF